MSKIHTVTLPDIGEGVVEGEVIEWLKKIGDSLKQDEPVVVVMTDKATVELPSPHPGILAKQYFKPGEKAILHKPLYDIEMAGEAEISVSKPAPVQVPIQKIEEKPAPQRASSSSNKVLATPPVRKLAKEMEIDINQIQGTGKEGRVTVQDIRGSGNSAKAPMTMLSDDEERPIIGIQGLMAKKMAESKRNIPHFSYYEKVEATRLLQLRENVNKEAALENIRATFMPFFIRALSLTVKEFAEINSSFDHNRLILHKQHNIGIAMSSERGLIVPVLKGVQEMSLREIIRAYEALKQKALAGKLQSSDMKESTISISNYGVLGGGGLWATPIINAPEVAILAVNKIQKQPMAKKDQLVLLDVVNLSWSFDHRVVDGDLAARVSHHFVVLIQNPAALL